MTKKSAKTTGAQGANVVVFNDEVLNKVRSEKKAVVSAQKDFRKYLTSNVEELQRMYEKDFNGTKGSIDYLCNVSGCKASDFFNVDFIKSLYKVYTFKVVGTDEVRTLIADEANVTEKTDFGKLSEKCISCPFIGEALDIEGTKFQTKKADGTLSGKYKYMKPIFNFTASDIIKHLLALDAYTLGVAAWKKEQKAAKAKAKKAEKKAAKAEAKAAKTNQTESK